MTIAELIERKEEIAAKKKQLYDIETSVGVMTFKLPTIGLVTEAWDMNARDGNKNLVYQCAAEPNLKNKELQKAYGVAEPFDIVEEIFMAGEVSKIAGQLLKLAGFGSDITATIHKEIKN